MTFNPLTSLLRVALVSKGLVTQSSELPQLEQVRIAVKTENSHDTGSNLSLLCSLTGTTNQLMLVNRKQALVLPAAFLSGVALKTMVTEVVSTLTSRLTDKTVSVVFNSGANKLTFVFKNSDALPVELRQLWKLFANDASVYTTEITFVLSSHNADANEALLRGYQLPVLVAN